MMALQDRWFQENIIVPFEKKYDVKVTVVSFDKFWDLEVMRQIAEEMKETRGIDDVLREALVPSPALERLGRWYGAGVTSPEAGTSSSAVLSGTIKAAIDDILAEAEVTGVTAEYGTYPVRDVLRSLQADNWLHARGDLGSELGRRIKAQIRRAFYPDEDDWKELVFVRARQIIRRALAGLASA